jgi:hypothetical protein
MHPPPRMMHGIFRDDCVPICIYCTTTVEPGTTSSMIYNLLDFTGCSRMERTGLLRVRQQSIHHFILHGVRNLKLGGMNLYLLLIPGTKSSNLYLGSEGRGEC